MSSKRLLGTLGAAVLTASVLAGCSGTGQEEGPAASEDLGLTYAVITHGDPTDAFWAVVQAGSDRAAEDLGVEVDYNSDPDVTRQSELIDNAVSQDVDGIVVSMANPEGLRDSVEAAVEAGVPVITINSGVDQSAEYGAITHIGQSEGIAGEAAGEQFNELGAQNLVCVIHEAGNTGLEQRCAGAADSFDGTVENLQVDGADTGRAQEAIQAALQADDSIDGVLTLNGQVAVGAAAAVEAVGNEVQVATFDLNEEVVTDVQDGTIAFAVDQQPYLQGYLGVEFLYLKSINGNDVGGGRPVFSGPAIVDADNADAVAEFIANGTR